MSDSQDTTEFSTSGGAKEKTIASTVSLAELYEKGEHFSATRTADCFIATEKASGERTLLWILRYPLLADSDAARQFVHRLQVISGFSGSLPKFRNFGVDPRGNAYLATDYVHGTRLLDQPTNAKAWERRFIEMLQAVQPLHQQGIVLGDLCVDSFVLNERGQAVLCALLGPFDAAAKQTAMLPPGETLQFLAPEQKTTGGAELASDVFALGVCGYRMLTGRFLGGERTGANTTDDPTALAPAPSSLVAEVPLWVDDVLGRCLNARPGERYHDVGEVLQVIFQSTQSGMSPGGNGRWSRRTLIVSPVQREKATRNAAKPREEATAAQKEKAVEQVTKAVNIFTWIVALLVGALGAGLLFYVFDKTNSSSVQSECSILKENEFAPAELKPLIFDVSAKDVPLEKRAQSLRKISESKDPVAYSILIAMAKCNDEIQLRQTAQEQIIARLHDQGMPRTSDVLEKWFSSVGQKNQNPADQPIFQPFLRACEMTRPMEARVKALQDVFLGNNVVATQLAAALSMDESEEHFLPVLRNFLSQMAPTVNYENRGVGALVLSNAALTSFFGDSLLSTVAAFSDADLLWSMEQLSHYDNMLLYSFAKEALKRRAVPPFQSVFLEVLSDSGKFRATGSLQQALVRGALGELQKDDIFQIGRWMSVDAERILLAICATAKTPEVAEDAFDVLASRSIESEPAKSLMKWVKGNIWDYRAKVMKAVGILGLNDLASEEDRNFAFEQIVPYESNGSLFQVLVEGNQEELIRLSLLRSGDALSADELLALLAHKNRGIRIAAVKALKGRNELSVLQGILQNYNLEKDEDVRAAYRENHWVTKDRESERMAQ